MAELTVEQIEQLSQSEEVMGRVYDYIMGRFMWSKEQFLSLKTTDDYTQVFRALSLGMTPDQMMGVEG